MLPPLELLFDSSSIGPRTLRVNPEGTGAFPTIQAAVDAAAPGDTVELDPGVYTWANQGTVGPYMVTIVKPITIQSRFGASTCFIDLQQQGGALRCVRAGDVRIRRLTVRNGLAVSGSASRKAILADDASPIIVEDCVVAANTSPCYECADGGGIGAATAVVRDSHFIDNHGSAGAAIRARRVTIERCSFRRNDSSMHGGGRGGAVDAVIVSMADCTLEENIAGRGAYGAGGAVHADSATMVRCTFVRNRAGDSYGGHGSAVVAAVMGSFVDCVFIANTNGYQDGVAIYGGHLEITGCTLMSNGGTNPTFGFGIRASSGVVSNTIVTGGTGRPVSPALAVSCCCFFDNTGGDTFDGPDLGGNIATDPRFCAADPIAQADVGIRADSPCAPGNHPQGADCGRIGAGRVACELQRSGAR